MINSKAIRVLKSFTPLEMKQFGKFADSPFHNNNKSLSKLFRFLKKRYPDFRTTNENVFRRLYPDKKYKDDVIRHLFADLYKLCEEFLVHSSLEKDNFAKKMYLLEQFADKRLDSLFLLCHDRVENEIRDAKLETLLFKYKGDLENIFAVFSSLRNKQHKITANVIKRSGYYLNYILSLLDYQISDLFTDRLNYVTSNEPSVFEAFVEKINLKEFSDWLNDNKKEDYLYLSMCCNLILLKLYPDDQVYFYRSKNIIFEIFDSLADEEKQYALDSLINYCNLKMKTRFDESFLQEKFEINKRLMTYLAKRDYSIRNLEYIDIIYCGVQTGELDWTENFINKYTKFTEDIDNMRNYASAILCFYKFEFEDSLAYANRVQVSDPSIKVDLRFLLLGLYYELNLFEQGINLLNSLRQFALKSKEISNNVKRSLRKKIHSFEKLYDLKINPEKIDEYILSELKKELNESAIGIRKWFLDKINNLEIGILNKKPQKKAFEVELPTV